MSCFFLAQITIHHRDEYATYEDGFDKIFAKYLGTVVAVDDPPTVLEGEWKHRQIVMIRFPSNEDA